MTIAPDIVGVALPTVTADVKQTDVASFREAIGDTVGDCDQRVPPTFLFSLEMRARFGKPGLVDLLGVDSSCLLHGEQSFTYHRALAIGERVDFVSRVGRLDQKQNGALWIVRVDTQVVTSGGSLVAEAKRSVVVRRGSS